MKVAIFGSWYEANTKWPHRNTHVAFVSACYAIGHGLAKAGHSVIAGATSPENADMHTVKALAKEATGYLKSRSRIIVIHPKCAKPPYAGLSAKFPGLFHYHPPVHDKWRLSHYLSIREADAVITIAGRESTYRAGLTCLTANKPLIPVASFGGASEKLLEDLKIFNPATFKQCVAVAGPWNQSFVAGLLDIICPNRPMRVLLIHGRSSDWKKLRNWFSSLSTVEVFVMQQEFNVGMTLPEKFESLAETVDAAIALATPDDFGRYSESVNEMARARQNVWLEMGWFWGCLGRNRVMLLCKGNLEIPSDVQGLEYHRYQDTPTECKQEIHCFIDSLSGTS